MDKRKMDEIKENYSYVDTKIEIEELLNSFIQAKVIRRVKNVTILDVKSYEDYLKAEEIKENYFEETKYDGYRVNPEITQEELEKPKVKTLVR